MGTFRAHNPETGMVHSRKSQRSRRNLMISDGDYTDKDYSMEDVSKQLVLYEPQTTDHDQMEAKFTEPIDHSTPLQQRSPKARRHARTSPASVAYTVQCANCLKWRIVPTKEKYEELRESVSQEQFVCVKAHEWNCVLSCDDPENVSQDGSKVWAIDKTSIAQPPPGWYRDVRFRGEGCSKFADVYYTSPSGKTLRSMVEIGRYLAENPYYIRQGVNLSQFSMATPKPLQEDYVRKRKYSGTRQLPHSATRQLPEPVEPIEADPLGWAPPTDEELLAMGISASNPVGLDEPQVYEAPSLRAKKRTPTQASPSSSEHTQSTVAETASSGEPRKRTLKQVSRRRAPT